MSRNFVVYGEFIVSVSGTFFDEIEELGLTAEPVRIVPIYNHRDIPTDGFGPNVPVETLWNMGECLIYMTLVNYDTNVLGRCYRASMGGGNPDFVDEDNLDGFMGPAGIPMGGGAGIGQGGNYYTSLHLYPTQDGAYEPYRFRACYLNSQPLEIPIGTERTLVRLGWRCIPYQKLVVTAGVPQEISAVSGALLFDFSSGALA